jgi:hypothetical protein
MVFRILNSVPSGQTLNILGLRKHQQLLQGQNHILKKTNCGILTPCYYGSWYGSKSASYEVHKF